MIATYIQELLATNNRVIVPNYGAFLVRATSKSKDANTLEEKLKDAKNHIQFLTERLDERPEQPEREEL